VAPIPESTVAKSESAQEGISRAEATGSSTVNRLASRLDRSKLQRRAMADGGEVFTGQVASRALNALGARAMTVDNSIIVSESFDPNRPEDAAVYAHEQYHLDNSGGVGENGGHDGEEVAARQVERMVFHRMTGGAESHEATHVSNGQGTPGSGSSNTSGKPDSAGNPSGAQGYAAMIARGMTRDEIVDQLAREVLMSMEGQRDKHGERGSKKGFQ